MRMQFMFFHNVYFLFVFRSQEPKLSQMPKVLDQNAMALWRWHLVTKLQSVFSTFIVLNFMVEWFLWKGWVIYHAFVPSKKFFQLLSFDTFYHLIVWQLFKIIVTFFFRPKPIHLRWQWIRSQTNLTRTKVVQTFYR